MTFLKPLCKLETIANTVEFTYFVVVKENKVSLLSIIYDAIPHFYQKEVCLQTCDLNFTIG